MKKLRFSYMGEEYEGTFDNGVVVGRNGSVYSVRDIVWLPPSKPRNIVGLALNYGKHAEELGLKASEKPVLFLKPVSSLTGHMSNIIKPSGTKYVHYEGELAVVMGKKCRNVSRREAMEYVLGYTVANDVTARDFITNMFRPPVQAKGYDTFCPVGPWIVTKDEIEDVHDLEIVTSVNGEVKQKDRTSSMIHRVEEIISHISSFMTLSEGDIILTGTPEGISPVEHGDVIEVTVEGIGTLRNNIVDES